MMKEARVVFGIFKDRDQLEAAVKKLEDSGSKSENISLLIPEEGSYRATGPLNKALEEHGTVQESLIAIGFPPSEAERCAAIVENGGALLTLHLEGEEEDLLEKAEKVFEKSGGADVAAAVEHF